MINIDRLKDEIKICSLCLYRLIFSLSRAMFIGLSLRHLHGHQIRNFLSSLVEDQKMAGIKSTV
jgi:hypothetical protein